MVQSGEIDESQKSHMIDWTQQVLEKLTVKYENISKEVDKAMGGYILHTRTDEILDEGRAEGEWNATKLMSYLVQNGRSDDVVKAAEDKNYLNQLLAEFKKTVHSAAIL